MTEHRLRQRQIERHQEDRPVDRVEADDVLSDHMQIGGPELFKEFGGFAAAFVSDAGDVVRERVEPDVDDVLRIEIDRNAPLERRARYAEVLKSGQQEVVHHLISARNGLDEIGMLVDVVDQARGVLAHLEEVRFFLRRLHLATAVGALAVHKLRRCEKRLARDAVQTFVAALVNVALVVHIFEDLLYGADVIVVGRADKAIVGRADKIPKALDLARDAVDIFLGRNARGLRLFFDLLTVFVRAGLQIYVITFVALPARDAVGKNRFIGVADVRFAGRIRDRRSHIILFSHIIPSPYSCQYKKPLPICQS